MSATVRLRSAVAVACAAAAVLTTSGCVVASPDTDTYADAAAQTAGTAVAETATVAELLRLLLDDHLPRPAAVAQLRYSEQGLDHAASWFTGLNPPVGSYDTDQRLGGLLEEASDLVATARISIHRDQESQYAGIADGLEKLGRRLEDFEADVS